MLLYSSLNQDGALFIFWFIDSMFSWTSMKNQSTWFKKILRNIKKNIPSWILGAIFSFLFIACLFLWKPEGLMLPLSLPLAARTWFQMIFRGSSGGVQGWQYWCSARVTMMSLSDIHVGCWLSGHLSISFTAQWLVLVGVLSQSTTVEAKKSNMKCQVLQEARSWTHDLANKMDLPRFWS